MKLRWRTTATMILVAVLLVPAVRDGDGVPLSSYPMYAQARSEIITFIAPVGIGADGGQVPLSTQTIASTSDPLIAESYLRGEIAGGRAAQLCAQIARRVGDERVVAIEIRSVQEHVVNRVLGAASLGSDDLLASCPVP